MEGVRDPKEVLLAIGGERESVPVVIAGEQYRCRTLLTVADVMGLSPAFHELNAIAQSCALFRLLGQTENGLTLFPEGEDDEWFSGVSAMAVHKGLTFAGVYPLVFAQLVADEEDGQADEGKPEALPT